MSTRRLLVLVLLLGLMVALRALSGAVVGAEGIESALLSIGFVVLCAYALAELTGSLGLPRVTGYILAGVAVGPYTSGLLDHADVDHMKVFNTLALAIIALEAGLELRVDGLKRVMKTLGSILLFKIPLSWLLVGGAFIAAAGLLPGEPLAVTDRVAIGLILGALAVGTSPAVSIAVISEEQAKGKLPDLVLGMAVFKDVVMIIMLAVALTAATGLSTGGGIDLGLFQAQALKVVLSVGAGAVLGGLLIAYLHWIRWEPVLVLLLLGYGVSSLADVLHLKTLLVFIAAGFLVTNFSRYGHDLHKPLALVALPVFVIFFTTVGAGLDLQAALAVAPVAAILFGARIAVMYGATRLGTRLAKEAPAFGRRAWKGFISQAGVALGLLLIAQQSMPIYADTLGAVGTVVIGLNLLVGPILLRMALTGEDADAEEAATGETPPLPPLPAELAPTLDTLVVHLDEALDAARREAVAPWTEQAAARAEALAQGAPMDAVLSTLDPIPLAPAAEAIDGAARRLRDRLAGLEPAARAPVEARHRDPAEAAGRWAEVRTRLWALRRARTRNVPLRDVGRARLEAALLPELAGLLAALGRAEVERLDRMGRLQREGGDPAARARAEADAVADAVAESAQALGDRLAQAREQIRRGLHQALADAGTPLLPGRHLRFRRVSRVVHEAALDIAEADEAWDPLLAGASERARVRAVIAGVAATLRGRLDEGMDAWRHAMRARALGGVEQIRDGLQTARKVAVDAEAAEQTLRILLAEQRETIDQLCCTEVLPYIDRLRQELRERSPLADAAEALPGLLESLPETVGALPAAIQEPGSNGGAHKVPLRKLAQRHFRSEFAWGLRDAEASTDRVIARLAQHLGDVAGVAAETYDLGLRLLDRDDPRAPGMALRAVGRGLASALQVANNARRELDSEIQTVGKEASEALTAAVEGTLLDALGPATPEEAARPARPSRAPESEEPGRALAILRALRRAVTAPLRWAANSQLLRDARRASGRELVDPRTMVGELHALTISAEQRERLPYVVTKLFTHSTLADMGAPPIGHQAEIAAIRAAFERSREGQRVAILLAGDEGSGKSSVAWATLRPIAGASMVRIEPADRTRSVEELCRILGAAVGAYDVRTPQELTHALVERAPSAILLDPLEGMFSRTTGGLAQMRALLRVIDGSCHKVCWAVCVATPTVQVLDALCGLSRVFTDHVRFPRLDGQALGAIMDARSRLSGMRVEYPTEPSLLRRLRGLIPTGLQPGEARRRAFYRELARASGGNISDASHLWLAAVASVQGDVIRLRPVEVPRLSWFDQLGRDAQHLLALMVVSGSVSREEAGEALNWTPRRLEPAWSTLVNVGLLSPDPDAPERSLVWRPGWRTVVDRLSQRGILPAGRP